MKKRTRNIIIVLGCIVAGTACAFPPAGPSPNGKLDEYVRHANFWYQMWRATRIIREDDTKYPSYQEVGHRGEFTPMDEPGQDGLRVIGGP